MKKLISIAAFILLAFSAFAQDGRSLYNKFSEAQGVSAVYISPAMFRLVGKIPSLEIGEGDVDISPVIRSLDGLYVIDSENPSINGEIRNDAERFIKSGKYELLMEVKEEGDLCHIYTVRKGNTITSLVLLSYEPDECTFICLDGQIPMDQFEKVISSVR